MTQPLNPAAPAVRDFTKQRVVQFQVNHRNGTPDVYTCVPAIPALLLVEFIASIEAAQSTTDTSAQVEMFRNIFDMVLEEDDAARFLARMRDKQDPIDLQQVMDIVQYVMEEYGLRPTTPSEPSAESSENQAPGTSSEANSSTAALTSAVSPSTNSSMLATTSS